MSVHMLTPQLAHVTGVVKMKTMLRFLKAGRISLLLRLAFFFCMVLPKANFEQNALGGGLPYLDVRAVIHLLYIFTYGRNALFNSFFAGLLGGRPNCSVPLWRCFESKKCCRKTRTCSTIVYSTVEEGLFQRAHTFW